MFVTQRFQAGTAQNTVTRPIAALELAQLHVRGFLSTPARGGHLFAVPRLLDLSIRSKVIGIRLAGSKSPLRAFEVNIVPFCCAQFAGTDKDQRHEAQGTSGDRTGANSVNSPDQAPFLVLFCNCGELSSFRGGQSAPQVSTNSVFRLA